MNQNKHIFSSTVPVCYAVIPEERYQISEANNNPNNDSPNQRWITQLQHCVATRTNFGEVKLELCPALQLSIECLEESPSRTGANSSLNIATKLVESLPDVSRGICQKYQTRIEGKNGRTKSSWITEKKGVFLQNRVQPSILRNVVLKLL